jgi:hypothetical protein
VIFRKRSVGVSKSHKLGYLAKKWLLVELCDAGSLRLDHTRGSSERLVGVRQGGSFACVIRKLMKKHYLSISWRILARLGSSCGIWVEGALKMRKFSIGEQNTNQLDSLPWMKAENA